MPTTYAHYKLGLEVRKKAAKQVAVIIEEYPQLFQIGLHGPDLLFYYNALSKNKVNKTGYHLHELPGRIYFGQAAEIIKHKDYHKSYLAYTLGFLCHYALDVTCHGWVNENVRKGIADHLEIEAELDRELLLRDGKDPAKAILTGHLNPSRKNAEVICDFFPELTVEEIEKSIEDMIFYLNLIVAKNPLKRWILTTALKLAGKYEAFHGLIINKHKNENCSDCTNRLLELFEEGKEKALRLTDEYVDYVYGIKELDPLYHYNFDSLLVP